MQDSEIRSNNNNFIYKINPRLYGFVSLVLGIGLGVITTIYVQDHGLFDFSEGITVFALLATPIFSIGTFMLVVSGLYYIVKGKWVESTEHRSKKDINKPRAK